MVFLALKGTIISFQENVKLLDYYTHPDDQVVLIEDDGLTGSDTPDGSCKFNAIPVYFYDRNGLGAVTDARR